MNPTTTAFLFPGQGSQLVGMGHALAQAYSAARDVFEQADSILGEPLSDICWHDLDGKLDQTYYTQPALFVTSMAALAAARASGWAGQAAFLAGHSLGEISAFTADGTFDFATGLRLVRERARLMQEAGARTRGGMSAILQLDSEQIAAICLQASQMSGVVVQIANDNCPGQVVISGDVTALAQAESLAAAAGARKVVRLPISVAPHSPLMASAVPAYTDYLARLTPRAPSGEIIANTTALPLAPDGIAAELAAQLTGAVRWRESMQYLLAQGVQTFVEIGSKDVLRGLLRRIDKGITVHLLGIPSDIDALLALERVVSGEW